MCFHNTIIINTKYQKGPLSKLQGLMSSPRILLIGGHGKVSLLLTPKLISRSWHVISVIRSEEQIDDVLAAGQTGPGKVETLVANLEQIKTESDAQKIIDLTKPEWVIWSAGK